MVFVLFSLSRGWGWWAAEGLLFIIRHCPGLSSDWPTAVTLACHWLALTPLLSLQETGLPGWLDTGDTWGQEGAVTDILTIFWHFSLISPVCCCPHVTWPRSLYRAPSLTRYKLSQEFPMIHSFNKSIEYFNCLTWLKLLDVRGYAKYWTFTNFRMIFNSRSGRGKWVSQTRSEKIYMQNNPQVCTFIETNSAAREIKNNDNNIKLMQSTPRIHPPQQQFHLPGADCWRGRIFTVDPNIILELTFNSL